MPRINVLVATNTLKGSLSAPDMAVTVCQTLENLFQFAVCKPFPIADGGDDTLLAITRQQNARWSKEITVVTGPLAHQCVKAQWLYATEAQIAIVEAAQAHGLVLARQAGTSLDALAATSYGVGELMLAACKKGIRRLVVTLGGSASTDGGLGALQALGVNLLDTNGKPLPSPFIASMLSDVAQIVPAWPPHLTGIQELWIATDTQNPLLGAKGTAYTFAPQKGATQTQCEWLETQLQRISGLMAETFQLQLASLPGAGAAGGLGYGLAHLPNRRIISGFEWLSQSLGLEKAIRAADIIVTGEGRFDATSLSGKSTGQMLALAAKYQKPVLLICAVIEPSVKLPPHVFPLAFSTDTEQSMRFPVETLRRFLHGNRENIHAFLTGSARVIPR